MTENYSKTYDQALKYLALRSHTSFELRSKLLKKKFDGGDIGQALRQLQEQKYLNDEDFARTFAQNLIKYKTFGYFGIKNKLKARGISDNMAESILSEELDMAQEKAIAQRALGKKLKIDGPDQDKQKLIMSLQRKGFRNQVIFDLVGESFE
jgi:regulatory protein